MNKVQNYNKEENPIKTIPNISPLSYTPPKIAQLSAIVLFSVIITTSLSLALSGPGISDLCAESGTSNIAY